MTGGTPVRIDRELGVDVAEAYRLWTDPPQFARWWWPFFADTEISLDVRTGGEYRIRSVAAGIGVRGRYLQIEPERLLRFTWTWENAGVAEPETDEVDVTFASAPGGSRVSVEHRCAAGQADDLAAGWGETLDVLVRESASPS